MEKTSIATLFYFIFNFLFSVVLVAISSNVYNNLSEISPEHRQLINNWKSPPLMEMVPSKTGQCSPGTRPAQFFSPMKWPGSQSGCNCMGINKDLAMKFEVQVNLENGKCGKREISAGCKDVNATNETSLSNWEWDVHFCVSTGNSSFSQTQYGDCSQGAKECYSTSFGKYCVPEGTLCPINGLFIGTVSPSGIYQTAYNINDTVALYYTRFANEAPIVEGKMEEYAVCKDNTRDNISPMRADYVLRNELRRPCHFTDPRWVSMVTDTEKDIYAVNNLSSLESSLPGFVLSTHSNISLFFRSYIPFKNSSKCLSLVGEISDVEGNLETQKNMQYNVVAMSITTLVLVCLLIVFEFIKLSSLKSAIGLDNSSNLKTTQLIVQSINYLVKLLTLIFFAIAVAKSKSIHGVYKDALEKNCGDYYTQEILDDFHDYTYQQVYLVNISLLSIITIIIIFDIILQIVFYMKKNRQLITENVHSEANNYQAIN